MSDREAGVKRAEEKVVTFEEGLARVKRELEEKRTLLADHLAGSEMGWGGVKGEKMNAMPEKADVTMKDGESGGPDQGG